MTKNFLYSVPTSILNVYNSKYYTIVRLFAISWPAIFSPIIPIQYTSILWEQEMSDKTRNE